MVIWWLCWHRTILIRNITQKTYSPFPPVHDFGKPWWGVAYVPCMTNLRALCARVIRWHVTCMLSLAEHWQGRRALSNHVCAHSVISMWHVVRLQHLARACSEQSRLTTVLPINHVIQMPQCLSGFVNHDYCLMCLADIPRSWHIGTCSQIMHHFDSLVQDCSISTANSLEILQVCTKPLLFVFPQNNIHISYLRQCSWKPHMTLPR